MKKIIITGASGFVGTNLALSLSEKYQLSALDLRIDKKNKYSAFYTWEDLQEIPFDDMHTVIHLAGKAHDSGSTNDAQAYFDINSGLTQKVFDRFLESKAKQFIFFSSVKAAADTVMGDYLTEDSTPTPVGPYGESKLKAEEYIQSKDWGDKRVYIFRPCMIHGPGNKGNLNLLYSAIRKGIPYPLGAFDNKRSFTSMENLSFIIKKVISLAVPSGVYNIADDDPISTNELIRTMCRVLDKKKRIYKFPKGLIYTTAKFGDFFHLPFNTFRLNKLTENYVVSNEKIKKSIRVKNLPVASIKGIQKTIQSFSE